MDERAAALAEVACVEPCWRRGAAEGTGRRPGPETAVGRLTTAEAAGTEMAVEAWLPRSDSETGGRVASGEAGDSGVPRARLATPEDLLLAEEEEGI